MYQYINAVTEMHRYRDHRLQQLLERASYDRVFYEELLENIHTIHVAIEHTPDKDRKEYAARQMMIQYWIQRCFDEDSISTWTNTTQRPDLNVVLTTTNEMLELIKSGVVGECWWCKPEHAPAGSEIDRLFDVYFKDFNSKLQLPKHFPDLWMMDENDVTKLVRSWSYLAQFETNLNLSSINMRRYYARRKTAQPEMSGPRIGDADACLKAIKDAVRFLEPTDKFTAEAIKQFGEMSLESMREAIFKFNLRHISSYLQEAEWPKNKASRSYAEDIYHKLRNWNNVMNLDRKKRISVPNEYPYEDWTVVRDYVKNVVNMDEYEQYLQQRQWVYNLLKAIEQQHAIYLGMCAHWLASTTHHNVYETHYNKGVRNESLVAGPEKDQRNLQLPKLNILQIYNGQYNASPAQPRFFYYVGIVRPELPAPVVNMNVASDEPDEPDELVHQGPEPAKTPSLPSNDSSSHGSKGSSRVPSPPRPEEGQTNESKAKPRPRRGWEIPRQGGEIQQEKPSAGGEIQQDDQSLLEAAAKLAAEQHNEELAVARAAQEDQDAQVMAQEIQKQRVSQQVDENEQWKSAVVVQKHAKRAIAQLEYTFIKHCASALQILYPNFEEEKFPTRNLVEYIQKNSKTQFMQDVRIALRHWHKFLHNVEGNIGDATSQHNANSSIARENAVRILTAELLPIATALGHYRVHASAFQVIPESVQSAPMIDAATEPVQDLDNESDFLNEKGNFFNHREGTLIMGMRLQKNWEKYLANLSNENWIRITDLLNDMFEFKVKMDANDMQKYVESSFNDNDSWIREWFGPDVLADASVFMVFKRIAAKRGYHKDVVAAQVHWFQLRLWPLVKILDPECQPKALPQITQNIVGKSTKHATPPSRPNPVDEIEEQRSHVPSHPHVPSQPGQQPDYEQHYAAPELYESENKDENEDKPAPADKPVPEIEPAAVDNQEQKPVAPSEKVRWDVIWDVVEKEKYKAMLAREPEELKRQLICEGLYDKLSRQYNSGMFFILDILDLAAKIVGMVQESKEVRFNNDKLIDCLYDDQKLRAMVDEAVAAIQEHQRTQIIDPAKTLPKQNPVTVPEPNKKKMKVFKFVDTMWKLMNQHFRNLVDGISIKQFQQLCECDDCMEAGHAHSSFAQYENSKYKRAVILALFKLLHYSEDQEPSSLRVGQKEYFTNIEDIVKQLFDKLKNASDHAGRGHAHNNRRARSLSQSALRHRAKSVDRVKSVAHQKSDTHAKSKTAATKHSPGKKKSAEQKQHAVPDPASVQAPPEPDRENDSLYPRYAQPALEPPAPPSEQAPQKPKYYYHEVAPRLYRRNDLLHPKESGRAPPPPTVHPTPPPSNPAQAQQKPEPSDKYGHELRNSFGQLLVRSITLARYYHTFGWPGIESTRDQEERQEDMHRLFGAEGTHVKAVTKPVAWDPIQAQMHDDLEEQFKQGDDAVRLWLAKTYLDLADYDFYEAACELLVHFPNKVLDDCRLNSYFKLHQTRDKVEYIATNMKLSIERPSAVIIVYYDLLLNSKLSPTHAETQDKQNMIIMQKKWKQDYVINLSNNDPRFEMDLFRKVQMKYFREHLAMYSDGTRAMSFLEVKIPSWMLVKFFQKDYNAEGKVLTRASLMPNGCYPFFGTSMVHAFFWKIFGTVKVTKDGLDITSSPWMPKLREYGRQPDSRDFYRYVLAILDDKVSISRQNKEHNERRDRVQDKIRNDRDFDDRLGDIYDGKHSDKQIVGFVHNELQRYVDFAGFVNENEYLIREMVRIQISKYFEEHKLENFTTKRKHLQEAKKEAADGILENFQLRVNVAWYHIKKHFIKAKRLHKAHFDAAKFVYNNIQKGIYRTEHGKDILINSTIPDGPDGEQRPTIFQYQKADDHHEFLDHPHVIEKGDSNPSNFKDMFKVLAVKMPEW